MSLPESGDARRWPSQSERKGETSVPKQDKAIQTATWVRWNGFRRPLRAALLLLLLVGAAACGDGGAGDESTARASAPPAADCFDPSLRETVEQFGTRLRQVSLLAPDSLVRPEIQSAYGEFVTPELLSSWTADPSTAPGRRVSSPWPERIEITGVEPAPEGGCIVRGEVVYSSSADPGPPGQVTLTVRRQGGWRIAGYSAQPER